MADYEFISQHPKIYRAVKLEALLPRDLRLGFRSAFFILSLISLAFYFVPTLLSFGLFTQTVGAFPFLNYFAVLRGNLLGAFLIFFAVFWFFWLLDFYSLASSRQEYFLVKKEERVGGKEKPAKTYFLDFGGARRAWHLSILTAENIDLRALYSFFVRSKSMLLVPLRLGVDPAVFFDFVSKQKTSSAAILIPRAAAIEKLLEEADLAESDTVGAREFIMLLYYYDEVFKKFLFYLKIRDKELRGAAHWAASFWEHEREFGRWWEKGALGRIPGIGKDLSFGFTYNLDKYSHDVSLSESRGMRFLAHQKEMLAIEEILSKNSEANVLVVGEEGSGRSTILSGLARMIWEGRVMPALEFKRMVVLDTAGLTSFAKSKSAIEEILMKIMNEALSSGNVILVIENFPEFMESAAVFGVDIPSLLEPYFSSAYIQAIVLSSPGLYHRNLETNGKVMKLFQKVEVTEPSREATIRILENAAERLEKKVGAIVTYPALESVYEMADRFVPEGAMPEKAIDLLDRAAVSSAGGFILPEHVEKVIELSTKIPVGKAGKEESELLLHLEEFLHKRIIGQDEAVKAIARVVRRLRAGLHTGKRPIGSFLFLWPTGVGKTETAKALAEAYFGSEKNMLRFDMSEFQSEEGIEKLIGSYTTKSQGTLATALRQTPFSVLLFDEFEKSAKTVINLFLQILDEGFFTDAFGKRVHAQDPIIIATSNAGSNLIWDLIKAGKDPVALQKEVVDYIRQQGLFTPEILNRFDAIVVYHPLVAAQFKEIARLMLEDLAKNLKEKDIIFSITPALIEKVAQIGYDPVMGARPMRRAIADRVEEAISKKILSGELERGSILEFSGEELAKL